MGSILCGLCNLFKKKNTEENLVPIIEENDGLFSKEIRDSLARICTFPCAIKEEGYNSVFENIDSNKYEIHKGNRFDYVSIDSSESLDKIKSFGTQNDFELNYLRNNNQFKIKVESCLSNTRNYKYFFGKYILYTINIKEDYINLTKRNREKFERIANSYSTDEEKLEDLEEVLNTIGYYVPTQLEIGGKFITKDTNSSSHGQYFSNINSDTNIQTSLFNNQNKTDFKSEQEIQNMFKSKSRLIKGGDTFQYDLEEWKKSINLDNAEVISYSSFIPIEEFIDKDTRQKLSGVIRLLNRKYKARKEYLQIIADLKKNNRSISIGEERIGSYESGLCKEQDYPKIRCIKTEAKGDGQNFQKIERKCNKNFKEIIVGWKVKDLWSDGTNGKWRLIKNPLLSKGIEVDFVSKAFRGEHFGVDIYVMEEP
jgi:hypothetical protein